MWAFFDFGFLMPTILEANDPLRREPDFAELSNNGEWDFQVRGRAIEHLTYFQEHFMEEGMYGRAFETPTHDYNARFYTTKAAFAAATTEAIMAIDYRNFKEQAEKYPLGHDYHRFLIDIWSASCRFREPGGVYGRWTPHNPMGYEPASKYSWGPGSGRRIGDSFANIVFEEDDEEEAYEPNVQELINELDSLGLDMGEWPDNVSPHEFELLMPTFKKHFGKKKIKKMRKRNLETFGL